jgi:hypothetical protein
MQALIGGARSENSAAVKSSFASTAAQVAKFAPEARAAQLATDAVRMYTEPGDKPSRHLAGLICRELARQAPDTFAGQASQVPPPHTDQRQNKLHLSGVFLLVSVPLRFRHQAFEIDSSH